MELEGVGEWFEAKTIGKQICNFESLLTIVAKQAGARAMVFVHSIVMEPKKIRLGFLVVDVPKTPRRTRGNVKALMLARKESE